MPPPGPQSKISVVKKGKMTFLAKRGKMTPLTPVSLDWGHLHAPCPPQSAATDCAPVNFSYICTLY